MIELALMAAIVAGITALTTDAIYSTCFWLIGKQPHPYQRPHRFRRYLWIVGLISTETALIAVLLVLLVRTIQPPGMAL